MIEVERALARSGKEGRYKYVFGHSPGFWEKWNWEKKELYQILRSSRRVIPAETAPWGQLYKRLGVPQRRTLWIREKCIVPRRNQIA
jgi:hypothetical protein